MMEACGFCGGLISASDSPVLDARRAEADCRTLAQRIGAHIQKDHPEVFKGLAPCFLEFQLLLYSFFLVEREAAELPAWRRGRAELHAKFRALMASERPITINQVQPAPASGGNGKPV